MSKHQGIIEFLAISGILPLAVILLCFIGGMFFLILCIFIVFRNKKNRYRKENATNVKVV